MSKVNLFLRWRTYTDEWIVLFAMLFFCMEFIHGNCSFVVRLLLELTRVLITGIF